MNDEQQEEFYNLMQAYRFSPFCDQLAVTKSFQDVKAFIDRIRDDEITKLKEQNARLVKALEHIKLSGYSDHFKLRVIADKALKEHEGQG